MSRPQFLLDKAVSLNNAVSRSFFVGVALLGFMRLDAAHAQTTVALQNFETPAGTPNLPYTVTATGTGTTGTISGSSGTGANPASTAYAFSGTTALQSVGDRSTIDFDNVTLGTATTPRYTGLQVAFRLAAFSLTGANGLDNGDTVTASVSLDGGTTYSQEVLVGGFSNARWLYSATGVAEATYDGNNAPIQFRPTAGGTRTTDGYSTVRINIPDNVNPSQVKLKLDFLSDNTGEQWLVDDVRITGTPVVATTGVKLSEFRTSGPAGPNDEYVELVNTTPNALGIGGWKVSVARVVGIVDNFIPANTIIPAGGHYLLAGGGYGLGEYATSNQTSGGDIIQDSVISLSNAAGQFMDDTSSATTSTASLTGQYAWVRPNFGDSFTLVSTDAANGTQLGTPGPQNLASAALSQNNAISYALVYPSAAESAAPNRVRSTSAASKTLVTNATGEATNFGTMQLRRAITNNTSRDIVGFRVRVINITSLNSPGYTDSTQADLRLMSSNDQSILFVLGGTPQLVRGTTVQTAPAQTRGAALNTSASAPSVTLAQPLLAGQTGYYNFMYGVIRDGRFSVTLVFEPIFATP